MPHEGMNGMNESNSIKNRKEKLSGTSHTSRDQRVRTNQRLKIAASFLLHLGSYNVQGLLAS
jgi:hypothetical protein